nr:MAG TPA: hypothetical protein [Caudoviricetes sp.]
MGKSCFKKIPQSKLQLRLGLLISESYKHIISEKERYK